MIGDRNLTRDDFPFPLDRPVTGQDLLQLLPSLLQPLWSQAAHAVRGSAARVTAVNAGPPRTVSLIRPLTVHPQKRTGRSQRQTRVQKGSLGYG